MRKVSLLILRNRTQAGPACKAFSSTCLPSCLLPESWGPNITPRGQSPGSRNCAFPLSPSPRPARGSLGASSQGSQVCRTRTFQAHAHRQTLLEAAEGTALTLRLVDFAALTLGARVMLVVLDCALEEALCWRKGENAGSRPSFVSFAASTPTTRSLALPCSRSRSPCNSRT